MNQVEFKRIDFRKALSQKAAIVNDDLRSMLAGQAEITGKLAEAMSYTLRSPGKRIRSALVLWASEIVSGTVTHPARTAACAVEMVHTYSLVHDDLPAMDDDDLRRGAATCHKAFDEATAILTGDALLTLAFGLLADSVAEAAVSQRLISILARAAGPSGMIAGQMADLIGEKEKGDLAVLENIHLNKTAKMFAASAAMGAVAGGGTDLQIDSLYQYGMKIGLGFQISDDLLDITATSDQLGKTAGKDAARGKMTYPAIMGIERSKKAAEKLAQESAGSLDIFDEKADILRQLAIELLERRR